MDGFLIFKIVVGLYAIGYVLGLVQQMVLHYKENKNHNRIMENLWKE